MHATLLKMYNQSKEILQIVYCLKELQNEIPEAFLGLPPMDPKSSTIHLASMQVVYYPNLYLEQSYNSY